MSWILLLLIERIGISAAIVIFMKMNMQGAELTVRPFRQKKMTPTNIVWYGTYSSYVDEMVKIRMHGAPSLIKASGKGIITYSASMCPKGVSLL